MKGDFSRSSFDRSKHYSSVRMQQGRVQLDADWNEQVDILQQQSSTALTDLLGVVGTPTAMPGFTITLPGEQVAVDAENSPPNVQIAFGHRYVDGILAIHDQCGGSGQEPDQTHCTFDTQADFPGAAAQRAALAGHVRYLLYLDLWQQHVTALEDPALLEVALDGLETATRTKTVAQVKFWPVPTAPATRAPANTATSGESPPDTDAFSAVWAAFQQTMQPTKGQLAARKTNPGLILNNQLYRVEIHAVEQRVEPTLITCKWSRENGIIAYPVAQIEQDQTTPTKFLIHLDNVPAEKIDLPTGSLVELIDTYDQLNGVSGRFGKVTTESRTNPQIITVEQAKPQSGVDDTGCGADQLDAVEAAVCRRQQMILRRWDQRGTAGQSLHCGAVIVERDEWITLEDDIQVRFSANGEYQVGDYWLIPVRTNLENGTGGLLWPDEDARPPHGIDHHYAPLALVTRTADQWALVQYTADAFRTLPSLTAEADQLQDELTAAKARITKLETDVCTLDARVATLEEEVARLQKILAVQRTQLYQDLPSMQDLEVGSVVAISKQWHDHVEAATLDNVKLLIGVVMEHVPDLYPSERYRVALQGRTQCKVVGAIEAGDLLVPCHLPGYARKAGRYIQPGTVIGKALADYQPGSTEAVGLIDILVTLS